MNKMTSCQRICQCWANNATIKMPKLAQRMHSFWDVSSSEGPRPFPRVDKNEIAKYIDEIQKSSCPGPLGQLQPNLAQKFLQ